MQSLSSFMSLGLNQLLTLWSDTAVFVLGVYFKIQSFVFMPIFGVNSGLIPILSYNYGRNPPPASPKRCASGRSWLCLPPWRGRPAGPGRRAHCCDTASTPVERPPPWASPALRMAALSFPIAAVSIILSAAFQSLGHSGSSLLTALLRQILLLLPIAALFLWLAPAASGCPSCWPRPSPAW